MSWAEIKKAVNSNIDVSLDKLIRQPTINMDEINTIQHYSTGTNYQSPFTFDIDSKVAIYYLYLVAVNNPSASDRSHVDFSLDGKEIMNTDLIGDGTQTGQLNAQLQIKNFIGIIPRTENNTLIPTPVYIYPKEGAVGYWQLNKWTQQSYSGDRAYISNAQDWDGTPYPSRLNNSTETMVRYVYLWNRPLITDGVHLSWNKSNGTASINLGISYKLLE